MSKRTGSSRWRLIVLVVVLALFIGGCALGPIGSTILSTQPLLPKPEIHLPAAEVFSLSGWSITNTMLASWLTVLILAVLFFASTRHMKLVPGRLQNAMETLVEMLSGFARGAVGKDKERLVFPVVATIFLLVFFNASLSLIPLFGTIGFLPTHENGEAQLTPLLRNANTDINMPLALAIVSFVCVEYWGIRSTGGLRYLSQFINTRNLRQGRIFIGMIDLFVGALEALSHFIRLLSFTFRLFGNMTAGKALLVVATFLIPFVFSVVFYGLELLIGFIQALVFSGLTLAFAAIAMSPHEEEHH